MRKTHAIAATLINGCGHTRDKHGMRLEPRIYLGGDGHRMSRCRDERSQQTESGCDLSIHFAKRGGLLGQDIELGSGTFASSTNARNP